MQDKIKCRNCGSDNIIPYLNNSNIHYCGNCDTNIEIVYEFLYNSDCCESAAATISIHKTKKSAEMAMEFHKAEKQKQWDEMRKLYEENDPEYWKEFKWDFDQWWGIRECELIP